MTLNLASSAAARPAMFAFAPMPFVDRGAGAIHLAPLLLLRSRLGEGLQVLADDAHLRFEDLPAGDEMELAGIPFKVPQRAELDALCKHQIPISIGMRLGRQCEDPLSLFKLLLTQVDEELSDWYATTLRELVARGLRAVIVWCNMPSLKKAALLYSLPIIHLELGPLRAPLFFPSMYVDFTGVNGNSAAGTVVGEYLRQPANIDFDQNRWAWAASEDKLRELSRQAPQYMHGVALQVEDDSNTIAFGRGLDGVDIIYRAWQAAGRDRRVLARDHPGAHFKIKHFPFVDVDQSADSLEFVSRCAVVHTINSSVAFESIFLGRETFVHGDSPLLAIPPGEPVRGSALSGLFFAYLVPAALALSPQYLEWRLERPHVADIARAHLDFLLLTRSELPRPEAGGIKSGAISPAFDSHAVGLDWLQSLSLVRRQAALVEQIAWLSEQRTRWEQKAQELEAYLKTLQEANEWLDGQRLAWERSAGEQGQVAEKALESSASLRAEVERLARALKDAQSMLDRFPPRTGFSAWARRWLAPPDKR